MNTPSRRDADAARAHASIDSVPPSPPTAANLPQTTPNGREHTDMVALTPHGLTPYSAPGLLTGNALTPSVCPPPSPPTAATLTDSSPYRRQHTDVVALTPHGLTPRNAPALLTGNALTPSAFFRSTDWPARSSGNWTIREEHATPIARQPPR